MIDGIKIKCFGVDAAKLRNNKELDFFTYANTKTGEIPEKTLKANYNGLNFSLTKSKGERYYLTIQGSLHKYFNNGYHNTNDFKTSELNIVINDLKERFGIIPEQTEIMNVELGYNIELPIKAKEFNSYIVSTFNKPFVAFDTKSVKSIGLVCKSSEYEFKSYDKGKQAKQVTENLLRIELKIKTSRYLKKHFDINTLADLQNPVKILSLAGIFIDMFNDVIIYEDNIDRSKLTPTKNAYLADHINPKFWSGELKASDNKKLTPQNRKDHKERFIKFLKRHSEPKIRNFVLSAIRKKNDELIDTYNENFVDAQRKKAIISEYKCSPKSLPTEKKKNKETEKNTCSVCGCDISHKKASVKYCSTKCKNKANNKNRTKAAKEQRDKEQKEFKDLKNIIPENNFNIQIFKKLDSGIITKSIIKQKDIKPLKYRNLRKIIQIKVIVNGETYILTTLRAKELIKYIYQINYKNVEKYKCAECNKEFVPNRKDAKYCSRKCKNKATNRIRDLKRKSIKIQV